MTSEFPGRTDRPPDDARAFLPTIELRRCLDHTLFEQRRARRRSRPITEPNLRRLFMRRWRAAIDRWPLGPDAADAMFRAGRDAWDTLRRSYER